MRSNSVRRDAGQIVDTAQHDLECFDQLDPRLRDFIQDTPEKLPASWLLQMQDRFGADYVLRRARDLLQKQWPGFKPVTLVESHAQTSPRRRRAARRATVMTVPAWTATKRG